MQEKKKRKIKEKAIGDAQNIKARVFDPQPSAANAENEVASPMILAAGELGKTASTIQGKDKKK